MTEPDWLRRAREEGRILSETRVNAGAVTADAPAGRPPRPKKVRSSGRYPSELDHKASEKQFTADVLDFARLCGWRSLHIRPAWTERHGKPRMITPVSGDGVGFLDIELVRPPRMLKIELKSHTGRVKPEQRQWIDLYEQLPAVEVFVWKPKDWLVIREVLAI